MNTYTFDSDFLDEYVVEDFRFDRSVSHLVLDELTPILERCDNWR